MSNYTLNNIKRFNFQIEEDDYWDMYINQDDLGSYSFTGLEKNENCLVSYIDARILECVIDKWLVSSSAYTWSCAYNDGLNLENIGFTGVDNGLFQYKKDRITNKEFYNIYTNSNYSIPSDDLRLHLHLVSGNTYLYDYPTSVEDGYIKLNGGFYQGFFKSGSNYQVLPSNVDSTWNLEFMIRPFDYESESNKTLNSIHPDNKGIFFYIGTRAENKWVDLYDNSITGITNIFDAGTQFGEDCDDEEFDIDFDDVEENPEDFIEDELDLNVSKFETNNGVDIKSANEQVITSDNKFLLFDRTKNGITTQNYMGNEVAELHTKKGFKGNLFLYMNHTKSGYTVDNIDSLIGSEEETYDSFYKDIYENALAFIVNDDGSIGYKYLIKDCDSEHEGHFSIVNGESYPNIVKKGEWNKINIKIKASNNMMKIYFYINDKLKYITSELPKLNLHDLDELDEKEEGVPYNISIGGGTQGLSERILPDYMTNPTKIYPLEQHFAGSFIGDFQYFKFYNC